MGQTARIGLAVIIGVILFALVAAMIVLAKSHGFDWQDMMRRMGIDLLFYQGSGARRWTSRFKLMNGQVEKEIVVGRDRVAEISPAVSLEAGELEIVVVDPKGKEFYRATYIKGGSAAEKMAPLRLPGPGRWRIRVIGRGARGGFRFTWEYCVAGKGSGDGG